MSYTSYFIQGFLRQPNRAKAREYLGIGEEDGGSGTPGPPGPPGSGDVTGPASAVAGNFASFGDGTGKLLADSGTAAANIPTANQKSALAGTNGAPAAGNPYVTDSDPRNTNARTPSAHAASHQNGGADEVNVGGLSGTLADPQTPALHQATHNNGGSDEILVGDLGGFPGGGTTFLRDDGTFAAAGGSSYWDVEITKSADQVVTNSTVLADDLELFTALDANSFYQIELDLLHSGNNTTGDYAGAFTIPTIAAGTSMGFYNGFTGGAVATIVALINGAAQWPATAQAMAGTAANVPLTGMMRLNLKTEAASGNLQWKFANFTANVGITSTTRAGSTLRVKKLFP